MTRFMNTFLIKSLNDLAGWHIEVVDGIKSFFPMSQYVGIGNLDWVRKKYGFWAYDW